MAVLLVTCRAEKGKVWPPGQNPPIVFMGLLDTVGAVGVPRIDGVGIKPVTYDYVPMRDFAVSSEVQNVFQACSTHDRYVGRVCTNWIVPVLMQSERGILSHMQCNAMH